MLRLLGEQMRRSGIAADDVEEVLNGYRRLQGEVVNHPDQLEPVGN